MAHKKAAGSTSNGRDSNPKMRGTKMYDGEFCKVGNIIVRQKGTKIFPGPGVSMGSDFTLFANREGKVKFSVFSKTRKIVSVI